MARNGDETTIMMSRQERQAVMALLAAMRQVAGQKKPQMLVVRIVPPGVIQMFDATPHMNGRSGIDRRSGSR